jgi:methylase of polypeptide subunit release factors
MKILENFFNQVPSFINRNGEVFLVWASFGDTKKLIKIIKKNKFNYEILKEKKDGIEWYIFKIKF